MGEFSVTPDSRFARVSRSAIVGASSLLGFSSVTWVDQYDVDLKKGSENTIEYIKVEMNTTPTAIRVFGAQTLMGVGRPRLFRFGFGPFEYILLFRSTWREEFGILFGRFASRRHGLNGEAIVVRCRRGKWNSL